MNEGKVKILEMLQEGKITVEQSIELMKQFDEDERRKYTYTDPRQINPNKRSDYDHSDENWDWDVDNDSDFNENLSNLGQRIKSSIEDALGTDLSDIGNNLGETFREIGRDLEDVGTDINIEFGGIFGGYKHKSSFTYMSDPISQNIAQLKLLAKNSKCEIKGYNGNRIKITCKFNPKRRDAQVVVNENNGSYEVLYDYNAMRSLAIYAEVPRSILVEHIHGESKNSSVELQGVKCRYAQLLTKNSSIRIDDVECEEISARTRNSSIKAERLTAGSIELETSNSKIDVENTTANYARLTTSNSKVHTEHCDIKNLAIKTSNAGIKMENIFKDGVTSDSWDTERIIEAHTNNGGVSIYIPRDVAAMVQASTSNGRVDCEIPNMLMNEVSKNYLSGKNASYDQAAKRAKINISTTNSTIKIREA